MSAYLGSLDGSKCNSFSGNSFHAERFRCGGGWLLSRALLDREGASRGSASASMDTVLDTWMMGSEAGAGAGEGVRTSLGCSGFESTGRQDVRDPSEAIDGYGSAFAGGMLSAGVSWRTSPVPGSRGALLPFDHYCRLCRRDAGERNRECECSHGGYVVWCGVYLLQVDVKYVGYSRSGVEVDLAGVDPFIQKCTHRYPFAISIYSTSTCCNIPNSN